jgi:hypothetical protein
LGYARLAHGPNKTNTLASAEVSSGLPNESKMLRKKGVSSGFDRVNGYFAIQTYINSALSKVNWPIGVRGGFNCIKM